jgi:predicted acyltransferase
MKPVSPDSAAAPRLQSLAAYRGLILFTLLCGGIFHSLKGHPTWHWLFLPNEHGAWEGCVYWDLIQPSSMFMVGVSMPLAFARRAELGDPWPKQSGTSAKRRRPNGSAWASSCRQQGSRASDSDWR